MNRELRREITAGEVERYSADGAICLRGQFDLEWIELLRAGVERVIRSPSELARYNTPQGQPGLFFVDFLMWRRFEEFRAFALDSPAPEIAARLMGSSRVHFYHDHLLVKEPRTQERTLWHHDQPYWPVDGFDICSIWLPLDPVPREVSPEWIRGSHRWGRFFAPRFFRDARALELEKSPFEPMPDIDAERERHEFLSWSLEPGDCIVFHARSVHGAPGNDSPTRRRRAYATRWTGDDATYALRQGEVSPRIANHGLSPGDPIAGEMFPLVWPRSGVQVPRKADLEG